MFGHRTVGSGLMHLGEFAGAVEHLSKLRELEGSAHYELSSLIYGIHPRTAASTFLSLTLYVLGYPSQARAAAMEALSHAQQLRHPHNLCYALYWSNLTCIQLRDLGSVRERAERLEALADEQGLLQWVAFGRFQQGVALAGLGDTGTGDRQDAPGTERVPGARLGLVRSAHGGAAGGRPGSHRASGRGCDHAGRRVGARGTTQELWFEAELHRLRGELLRQSAPDTAEGCFRQALATAQRQKAKSWELRAATSLARLLRDQGRHEQARQILAPVHGWFTEGFETADLQEAKALLEELEAARVA